MLAQDINSFIRRAFVMTRTPYNKLVKCADCRLFYILDGSGTVTIKNQEFCFSKDSLFLWKSGTEYKWNFSKTKKPTLAIINFDYTQSYRHKKEYLKLIPETAFEKGKICETEEFYDITFLNEPVFFENMQLYKKDILDIIEEFQSGRLHAEKLAETMLSGLFLKLSRHSFLSSSRVQSKIEPVIEYINQNFDKEITNIFLGKMFGYHPHYINILMKEYTGITLHSYLTDCRMNKAVKLILDTELSVEDIALSTGFKNPSHFCKIFKQRYGVSPSGYRKSAKMI